MIPVLASLLVHGVVFANPESEGSAGNSDNLGSAGRDDASACVELPIPKGSEIFDFKSMRAKFTTKLYEGKAIRRIETVTLPIFNKHNPDENNTLYQFVDGIHSPTQSYVIRQQLLFKEGDILQFRLVPESERILRDNSYLSDAIVLPRRDCGDSVDLVVVVRDLWTLLPKLIFSRKGGNNKYGLTIEDKNILGTGNTLFFQFINDRERDSSSIGYRTKNLFGTRTELSATYSDTTDGVNKSLKVFQPFYSLDTRWSLGMEATEISFTDSLEAFDEDINEFEHEENDYTVFAGYSLGLQAGFTQRYSIGISRSEDFFEANSNTAITQPADRELTYPWLRYSVVEDDFVIYKNLDSLFRTEDVTVGLEFSLLLGYADEAVESELSQWVYSLIYSDVPFSWEKHLLKTDVSFSGFYDTDAEDFVNAINSFGLSYYWLMAARHRFFVGLSYDQGENLTQDQLLPLGGDQGLRGYPSEYLLGDRRFLLNLEQRYYFDTHYLNLLRFAGVLFVDVGQTEFSDIEYGEDSDYLAAAGIGLRINSSKTNISRIVHIDLAFPLNEKDELDEYQLRLTSDATF